MLPDQEDAKIDAKWLMQILLFRTRTTGRGLVYGNAKSYRYLFILLEELTLVTWKKRKNHQCNECHMSFSRPSHLNRHVLSHRSKNDHNRAYSCTECEKRFFRRDILLRHLRSVHRKTITLNESAQRSCLRCVAKKMKCDRAHPCQSCIIARSKCFYRDESSKNQQTKSFSAVNTPGTESADGNFQQLYPEDSPGNARANQSLPWNESVNMTELSHDNSENLPMEESTDVPFLPSGAGPGLEPYTIPGNMADQLVSPGPYVDGEITDLLSNGMSLGYGGLDWLEIQLQDHLPPTNIAINTAHSKELIMTPPTGVCYQSGHESHLLSLPSWHNATQSQNMTMNPAFPRPGPTQPTVQQWPFDGTREQVHPRYRLSPLRDVLQGIFNSTPNSSHPLMRSLVDLLSNKYVPKLDENTNDYEALRAMHLLQRAIDSFISQFHIVLPTVHIPTLTLSSCPTVLLTSMACIGAMLLEDTDALDKAEAFSKICATVILWLVSHSSVQI
jgi:hypothetical protein